MWCTIPPTAPRHMSPLLISLLSFAAHAEDHAPTSPDAAGFPFAVDGATVQPSALLQLWLTAYDMDADTQADSSGYGDPEDDEGLKVKRFKVGIGGEFKKWRYRLGVASNAPYDGLSEPREPIEVEDAWIGVVPVKGLKIQLGQSKLPFSRDQMMASGELVFTERGIASEHLTPERSLGLLASFARGGGKFSLGGFNAAGDLFGDAALGKTVVGRLEWDAGTADTYKTWGDRKDFGLGIGANAYYTMGVATDTWAAGGDAMLRVAGFSMMVDGAFSKVTPTETTVDSPEVWEETDRWGVTAQLSYQVGAFEPALRYSIFDDSTLGQYSHVLAGGEWHTAQDHIRLGAGYELRLEGSDAVDNDTARLWAQFRL
jgi:hypothetical protein